MPGGSGFHQLPGGFLQDADASRKGGIVATLPELGGDLRRDRDEEAVPYRKGEVVEGGFLTRLQGIDPEALEYPLLHAGRDKLRVVLPVIALPVEVLFSCEHDGRVLKG